MKKIIAYFLFSSILNAAPVGNTSAPAVIQKGIYSSCDHSFSLRSGYEGDFVADGRMNQYNQGTGRVDTYEQYTQAGSVTLTLLNRLDIYGILGSSSTQANWRFTSGETTKRIQLKTQENYLWAAGARLILFEWWNTSLGMGGRYAECHYLPKSLTSDGVKQSVAGSHLVWKDWQINLDVSYKIKIFIPYIGIKYAYADSELSNFTVPISAQGTSNSFETRVPIGMYLGCALSSGNYFALNLEGRLIDEEAISISADFKF